MRDYEFIREEANLDHLLQAKERGGISLSLFLNVSLSLFNIIVVPEPLHSTSSFSTFKEHLVHQTFLDMLNCNYLS